MTAEKTHDPGRVAHRRKVIGLLFMAPPVTVFAVFAVAEGIGLEPGWWGHLLQLAAAVLLGVGAWFRPRIGGPLLTLSGIGLAVFMLLRNSDGVLNLPAIALVFAPLVVAGIFFTLAGSTIARTRSHR